MMKVEKQGTVLDLFCLNAALQKTSQPYSSGQGHRRGGSPFFILPPAKVTLNKTARGRDTNSLYVFQFTGSFYSLSTTL